MVKAIYTSSFKKKVKKINPSLLKKVKKQIEKIANNPLIGKPMKHKRKYSREVYISPFRLSYVYDQKKERIIFLDIYHKDKQ